MADLTEKELTEQALIKKYKGYAALASDPQLSALCSDLAARHKQHFDTLMGHLQ